MGNNPNFYVYVFDSNVEVDPLGLMTVTNTVDFTGHADLFPTTGNQKNIVTIQLTGRRSSDFTQAYKEAVEISKKQGWHLHVNKIYRKYIIMQKFINTGIKLTESDIMDVSKSMNLTFPKDLVELYIQYNG